MAEELQVYDSDDIELTEEEVSVEEIVVDEDLGLNEEEQILAYKILARAARLKGVTIDRDVFLRTELSKRCPSDAVDAAVATSPQEAGISMDIIDSLADASIALETNKVTGLSALAGIPGGLAMFGTIPADIVSYFAHSLRIEQKLAYLYGWQSFLNDEDEIDDETMMRLILFLGVMMQVGGANVTLTKFAANTATKSVAKTIEKQALTKTFWYGPLKKILRVVGVNVTKKSFAEVVAKGVPLLGGVISGGLTYATFRPGAVSLKKYLRMLPQATGVFMTEEEVDAVLETIEEESKADFALALAGARDKAVEAAGVAANRAGFAARAAASGLKKGFGGIAGRFGRTRKAETSSGDPADIAAQLQAYKDMLDNGLITQDDYDAKKREILGL